MVMVGRCIQASTETLTGVTVVEQRESLFLTWATRLASIARWKEPESERCVIVDTDAEGQCSRNSDGVASVWA